MKTIIPLLKSPKISLHLFGILFVFLFYGKIILHPNDYMFSTSGDGIKNYYTYSYQIVHGNSLTNFEGMNYPYGESILYTDCHPILTLVLQPLSKFIPWIKTHHVGILNSLLILGIFFTLIIVYQLLITLRFNPWLSIAFAFGIMILAPQIFRIDGHYALSYSMAIPLTWLLTLKSKQNHWKWITLLFLNNLFWLLVHAYLGMIIFSFIIMLVLFDWLINRKEKKSLKQFLRLMTAITLPVLLFFVLTKTMDSHIDRTTNPSGFLLYNAELDDVFLPHSAPLRPLIDKISPAPIKLQWEAWGYVGIINTLLFITLIIIILISIRNKHAKKFLGKFFQNQSINTALVAAIVVLIFALGIPFKQFPSLLDYIPIIKPFRATGRFVWPFYFAYSIFGAYIIQLFYYYLKSSSKTNLAYLSLFFWMGITAMDGIPYHSEKSNDLTKYGNLFDQDQLSNAFTEAIESINPYDYQAIISLPYFHHGSETFSRPRKEMAVTNSIVISYHTGLPMVNANLTRVSISESKNNIQMIGPNYYEKPIENDLISNQDFLLVHSNKLELTPYEKKKLSKGKVVFQSEELTLLSLSKQDLFEDEAAPLLNQFSIISPTLFERQGFLVSDSSSYIYYQNYDHLDSDTTYRGKGSYSGIKKGKNILANFPSNTFKENQTYHTSVWMYNGEPDALNLWFRLEFLEYDPINQKSFSTYHFPENSEVINADWSMIETTFTMKNASNELYIITQGKENSKAKFHADELLIREKGVSVYRYEDEFTQDLFYNNHTLRKKN